MATKETTQSVGINLPTRVRGSVQTVYDSVLRDRLPRRLGVFNGVTARGVGLLDASDHGSEYQAGIVRSLRQLVQRGDDIIVIGGGLGVSTAVAAGRTGDDGSVITYEAAQQQLPVKEETASIRGVQHRVDVRHAFVGDVIQTRGALAGATQVTPDALPECDVLEVDAEGAELEILRALQQRPRVVIVESHGFLDRPTAEVRQQLERMDYEIVREEPEVAEKDVMVLTGVHESADRE